MAFWHLIETLCGIESVCNFVAEISGALICDGQIEAVMCPTIDSVDCHTKFSRINHWTQMQIATSFCVKTL